MPTNPSIIALPELNAAQRVQSTAVTTVIRDRIDAAGGWITFADFMQIALYEPGLGYYSAGAQKFGAAGDFITAPELSELFCECVAAQMRAVLRETGGSVLELGAGTGRLAAVALLELESSGGLADQYCILEVAADLRARQRLNVAQRAGNAASRARWLTTMPAAFTGVVFANEVLDAMPCERFVMRGGVPRQLGVGCSGDGFAWQERPKAAQTREQCSRFDVAAAELAPQLQSLADGYMGELNTLQAGLIAALGDALDRGVVLFVDYGLPRAHFYHPQRGAGSLRCYFQHRAHDDPFFHVGLTDITAWVDFTRIAAAAQNAGLCVAGFTTQAAFLLGNGIEQRMRQVGDDALAMAKLAHQARQLLLPGEMGEAFKVMALTKNFDAPLPAFVQQDLRYSL